MKRLGQRLAPGLTAGLATRLGALLTARSAAAALVLLPLLAAFAAPPAEAQSYRIRAGDVLRVEVLEDPNLNRQALVSPDGRVTLPLAGSVAAAGRSVEDVQAALTERLAPNFAAGPTVSVSLESLAQAAAAAPAVLPVINVYVLGEVGKPGKLQLDPGTTVLQAFAQMGGFTPFAATKRVQLRRAGTSGRETVYTLNYPAIESGVSPNGAAVLTEGDVIVVPQRRLFE